MVLACTRAVTRTAHTDAAAAAATIYAAQASAGYKQTANERKGFIDKHKGNNVRRPSTTRTEKKRSIEQATS